MIAPTRAKRKQPHGCVSIQRELAPDARGTGNATESSMSSVRAIDDVKYAVERVPWRVHSPLPGLCLWPRCLAALPLGFVSSAVPDCRRAATVLTQHAQTDQRSREAGARCGLGSYVRVIASAPRDGCCVKGENAH